MKYQDVRGKIKTGDVIAWSYSDTVIDSIIKWATKSKYNHVGVAYVVGGRVFVVEAVIPYVRIFPLSRMLPFYHLEMPYETTENTECTLLNYVGKPYSIFEAVKSLFSTHTNSSTGTECSKLVNDVLVEFDQKFYYINDTPVATVNLCEQLSGKPAVYVEA